MGIPSYFSWIVRHFEKSVIATTSPFMPVHQLYLDFNCAIHPVARSHPDYTIECMCDNVVIYLEYLIQSVKPTELIYVAIDGVAPVGKMKQQRLRRYKSVQEVSDINQIKRKFGINPSPDHKDFNMISPATVFMSILSDKIDTYLKRYQITHQDVQIIFSDACVPAEGEHKILQHLKTQPLDKNCVIYGLDSDLIMLSLSSNRNHLVLIRENNMIKDNNVDISIDKFPELNYFLIDELKTILFNILTSDQNIELLTRNNNLSLSDLERFKSSNITSTMVNSIRYDINRIIKDYILMSFLLGNDFVPSFLTLKIRENGIEKILKGYQQVIFSSSDPYLWSDNLTFNVTNLLTLIHYLVQMEEPTLQYQKRTHDKRLSLYQRTEPNDLIEALDQYQKVDHLYTDYIDAYHKGWQKRYYHYFFHIKIDDDCHRQEQIDQICAEYITTLHWIGAYYCRQCPDWYWVYPYEATPLLSDLENYIKNHSDQVNLVNWTNFQPVNPYYQLMMILPPQSSDLLPNPFRYYMNSLHSPLIHYYPIDFELEYYGKRLRWEVHPKIPMVDPVELRQTLNGIEKQLSVEEQQRGTIGQIRSYLSTNH
jgi:5'-3' exonuclease